MNTPLAAAATGFLNHVLAPAEWARTALQGHAGQRVRLILPPLDITLLVTSTGEFRPAQADEVQPDLSIALSPLEAVRFLAGERAVFRRARIDGDAAFAATLRHLGAQLRWDYEEDLSRFMGDVAAHRAAGALRSLGAWPRQTGDRLARAGAEYVTEEAGWLPPVAQVEAWLQAVDLLREDAERLEHRIAALEGRRA